MLGWWGRLLLCLRDQRIGGVVKGGVIGLIIVRGMVCVLFGRVKGARLRLVGTTYWRVVRVLSVRGVRGCGGWRQAKKRVVLRGGRVILIVHSVGRCFAGCGRRS